MAFDTEREPRERAVSSYGAADSAASSPFFEAQFRILFDANARIEAKLEDMAFSQLGLVSTANEIRGELPRVRPPGKGQADSRQPSRDQADSPTAGKPSRVQADSSLSQGDVAGMPLPAMGCASDEESVAEVGTGNHRTESAMGSRTSSTPFSAMVKLDLQWPAEIVALARWTSEANVEAVQIENSFFSAHSGKTSNNLAEMKKGVHSSCAMINPNSGFHMFKSVVSMSMLVYELTLTPFALAWNLPVSTFLSCQGWSSAVFWTLELILDFRTGIYLRGELETNPKVVARHYLKTWFFPDLLLISCDWLNVAVMAFTSESAAGGLRVMRFLKLGRLVRFMGLIRMLRVVRLFEDFMQYHLPEEFRLCFKLLTLFITIMWIAHMGACMWFAIGVSASTDTGSRWIDSFGIVADGVEVPFLELPVSYQYTTSFHWAAGQMALGGVDQMPKSSVERMVFILVMMVGFLFGTSLISSLSAAMVDFQMMQKEKNQKLRDLRQYLAQRQVESALAVPIQKQAVQRLAQKDRLVESEVVILEQLSAGLREKLHFSTQRAHLEQHPLFRLCIYLDTALMQRVSSAAINFMHVHSKDDIFVTNVVASHAYYLAVGTVAYRQEVFLTVHGAKKETKVQREAWLCEAAMWCEWTHVGTAEAVTQCELLAIDVVKFCASLQANHVLYGIACEYCSQFHRRLKSAYPPLAPWPTDLHVPFTDYCGLVVTMPQELQEVIGRAAVSQLAKKRTLGTRTLDKIKEEVNGGKCILVTTGEGGHIRLVSLVVLKIERNSDRRIFTQVGKWDGMQASPACQLPGGKLVRNELMNESVDRIFRTKLPLFCDKVDIRETVNENETQMSKKFGVKTQYMRTICTARLRDDEESEAKAWLARGGSGVCALGSCHEKQFKVFQQQEIFAVWGDDETSACLFAWLMPQELDFLGSSAGGPVLEAWLSSLLPPGHARANSGFSSSPSSMAANHSSMTPFASTSLPTNHHLLASKQVEPASRELPLEVQIENSFFSADSGKTLEILSLHPSSRVAPNHASATHRETSTPTSRESSTPTNQHRVEPASSELPLEVLQVQSSSETPLEVQEERFPTMRPSRSRLRFSTDS